MLSPSASEPLSEFRAAVVPWLPYVRPAPGAVSEYWRHHLGHDFDEVPSMAFQAAWLRRCQTVTLKILTLDVRVTRLDTMGDAATWNTLQAPQWIDSATILSRLAGNATGLEEVHIRLSTQEQHLQLVQDLIRSNPNINSLIIEVDSALDLVPGHRPVINLERWFDSSSDLPILRRFILRAPACVMKLPPVSSFLTHLSIVNEVRIAVYRLELPGQPWQWCMDLLRACPQAKVVELATCRGNTYGLVPPRTPAPVVVPELIDLTLDLPEVDARLLGLIKAPSLSRLRINSRARFDDHGKLSDMHFPALSWVRIGCYSPVAERLEVLGLPRASYSHNLVSVEDPWVPYDGDFVADIRMDQLRAQHRQDSPTSSASSHSSLWLQSPHASTSLVLLSPGAPALASPPPLELQAEHSAQPEPEAPAPPSLSAFVTPDLHLSPESQPQAELPNVFAAVSTTSQIVSWTLPAAASALDAGPSAHGGPPSASSETAPPSSSPPTSPLPKRLRRF
ncbi:hypothetical protein OC842_004516 [Tilletia horrida]|uniref:Uncharacterized protein n=1 Tax=Tilletia horrida TaxID=155126 RepID=A0AAN6JQ81_9BASI|nr:hypothetical protein OC842_004516 [Tilletia horrida]